MPRMAEIINIDDLRRNRALTVEQRYEAWKTADTMAKETQLLADCIAAGLAWRAWLELFVPRP
jgi:hypothetical protein